MYDTCHEMGIRQFCDALNERLRKAKLTPTRNGSVIQNGLSQNELAEFSRVLLRTLRQYEQ